MLKVNSLCKEYGSGDLKTVAVKNATLTANEGEVVFIMGPSGSGKTTLLSMLGLLLPPTSGEIILNDKKIEFKNSSYLSKFRLEHIGFVFQNFKLISSFTILENVMVVLNIAGIRGKVAKERAIEVLNELGLGHRLNHYPTQISGGEKQRVAIARALINDPDIIFADEPTANLDKENGKKVSELLRDLVKKKNKSLILVTHDSRITHIADTIYTMSDGIIK